MQFWIGWYSLRGSEWLLRIAQKSTETEYQGELSDAVQLLNWCQFTWSLLKVNIVLGQEGLWRDSIFNGMVIIKRAIFITSWNILGQLQVWRQRTLSPEVFWKIVFHSFFHFFLLVYSFIANSSIMYYLINIMFE